VETVLDLAAHLRVQVRYYRIPRRLPDPIQMPKRVFVQCVFKGAPVAHAQAHPRLCQKQESGNKCDTISGLVKGTNIAITLGSSDKDEIERVFAALADGGKVAMPLGKTFFSELYGMLTDRFGIIWQLSA